MDKGTLSWPRGWLVVFLIGVCLFAAGVCFSGIDPYASQDWPFRSDPRYWQWSALGLLTTGAGLLVAWTGAFALLFSLATQAFRSSTYFTRPVQWYRGTWQWRYAWVALIVASVGIAGGLGLSYWYANTPFFQITQHYAGEFTWTLADGFTSFRILRRTPSGWREVRDPLWQALVAFQAKPRFQVDIVPTGWKRMRGNFDIRVMRVVPVVVVEPGGTVEDPDETALMRAAETGDESALMQVLARGADVNVRDQSGRTALIYACSKPRGTASIVRDLLGAGADPNLPDRWGNTALYYAVGYAGGHEPALPERMKEVVSLLLASHADPNLADRHGIVPLMVAATVGDAETALRLIRARADVNVTESQVGNTALIYAARNGHSEVIKVLLAAGANVQARNQEGQTALSLALERQEPELARLLRRAGAHN